jgi:hypothetical protein
MTIQELFIRSNEELKKVIDQIADQQWDLDLPAGTTSRPAQLKDAINYHSYDDAWVPDVLDGKTKEEVNGTFEPILATPVPQIKAVYATYNAQAIAKVRGFNDLNKTVHLSYGDFPAKDYLQHIVTFRAFRVYDIAKLIGVDSTMAPDFVEALLEELTPVVEQYRQMGVFPPAIEVASDASPQVRLLAMVGRE